MSDQNRHQKVETKMNSSEFDTSFEIETIFLGLTVSEGPEPCSQHHISLPMPVSDNCILPTLNTHCQLDVQQFWRHDLRSHRTTSLEQFAALVTMWAVIRPVQAVTEDSFIRTVRP